MMKDVLGMNHEEMSAVSFYAMSPYTNTLPLRLWTSGTKES